MAKEFDSIQTLLKQVHGTDKPGAGVEVSPEEKAREQEEKLRQAVAKFKAEVLADADLQRRLKKFRREGIYSFSAGQLAAIFAGIVLFLSLVGYVIHFASSVTRYNLAIRDGLRQIQIENFDDGIEYLESAIRIGAPEAATIMKFAYAMKEAGRHDSAVALFDRAGQIGRGSNDYPAMVEAAVGAAEVLLEEGRLQGALERVKPIITLDPKERNPLIIQGRVYFAQSRYSEAEQSFINSLERNPVSLTPRYYLRETYLKMGRIEDARQQEDFLLYSRPSGDEDRTTLIGYADLLIRAGMIDEAEEVLKPLAQGRRPPASIMVTLGHLAIEKQDLVKAGMYAESAVLAAPNDPHGYILRSELHYHYGRGREAIRDLNHALNIDPLNAKALYNMGNILFYDLRLPSQALSYFKKSIRQGFDAPFLWYNIGTAHLLLNESHEATLAYDRMPRFVKASSDVKWSMGNAYLLDDQLDTALDLFLELSLSRENDAPLENNLGVIHEIRGDTMKAQRHYWSAVQITGDDGRETIALGNINRMLRGLPVTDLRSAIHLEIPLKPRGVVVPARPKR